MSFASSEKGIAQTPIRGMNTGSYGGGVNANFVSHGQRFGGKKHFNLKRHGKLLRKRHKNN